MASTVEQLARFAATTHFDELPDPVVHETRRLLLDSMGCALAGLNSDKGRWALNYAREFHGGSPQAQAIGVSEPLSVLGAAFVNGELINALDYDAGSKPGHVSPFVIPAALAVAQWRGRSGRDLIVACALAHEISHRIGTAMSSFRDVHHGKVDWPAVAGYSCCIFGGTAAVASLERLDEHRLAHALGLAGHLAPMQTQSAWINNVPPTTAKYLMAGSINEAAISATYLARAGHRGNLPVLDGDYGFWRFAGSTKWNGDAAVADLGREWRFPRVTTYKQYPICRIMHGALDGLSALIAQHRLRADEISHVHAWLEASCVQPVFSNRIIANQVDAQFSIPYGLAMVALGIPPGARWQDAELMHSAEVLQFMERISFAPHPGYVAALQKNPQARISKVEVSARGQVYTAERDYIKGTPTDDPATALTDAELLTKFSANAAAILPAARIATVSEELMALEQVDDVSHIMALLTPSRLPP